MQKYAVSINANGTTSWRALAPGSPLAPGEVISLTIPEPTIEDAVAALTLDIQAWLDATAQGNGYDSLASCISYKDSAVAQWASDASAAIAWRDAVWAACFQWQQSAAQSPPSVIPTSDEVIAQMPQPEAFGWVRHAPGQA